MTYQSPGVYIEEVPSGPQPIAAASTSVVAILGTTRKGPVLAPTRVTGWSDFVRTFGDATARSRTAESVFGFFENGGPAAWVVRVDPSSSASWIVRDVSGAASFTISASSPGTWGNALTVGVAADPGGAAGSLYSGVLGGAATVSSGTVFTVPLSSTAGLRPGDPVVAVARPSGAATVATANGTVQAVGPTSATVDFGAAVTFPAGSVLAGRMPAATTVFLPTAKGFKAGDVIVVTAPNGARTSATVTAAVDTGSGMTLTLAAAATDVPGAAYVQRRATIPVTVTVPPGTPAGSPPTTNVGLGLLGLPAALGAVSASDLAASGATRAPARIVFADGRTSTWSTNTFPVVGADAPPSGPADLTMGVFVALYAETGLNLIDFGSAELAGAFGWVPEGTVLTLTGAGATTRTATRTASSAPDAAFTLSGTPSAGIAYTAATVTPPAAATASLLVRSAVAPRVGDALTVNGNATPLTAVESKGGDAYLVTWGAAVVVAGFTSPAPLMAVESASVTAERFAISVSVPGAAPERIGGLSLSPSHPSYFAKDDVVNGVSAYVTVSPRAAGAPAVSLASAPFYATSDGIGGDGTAAVEDFRKGLEALEAETEPALVICPDSTLIEDPALQADLIGKVVTHCERFRRFAIIDPPDEDDDQALRTWRLATVNSTYAAVYAPHLEIVSIDPASTARLTTVPPSGFVAGVFARTDRERGVHKAPGNERVAGVVGVAQSYTQRRQDLLNPEAVNLIRVFPGRGTRIWGARNATDDVNWRYVNVRRLFNMIETSVERSTQWVVFEPNTASTWIRIKVSIENFLDQQWRAGALAGTRPEEAYRVRVGLGETMTETDIALGLVVTEVAIAAARPSEFVVFRFSHKQLSE